MKNKTNLIVKTMFIFKYIYKYTFNTNNTINTNNINIITKQIFGKSLIPFRPKTG